MSATTRKKLPVYQSDEEAEVFVAEANLSEYDLRGRPMSEVFPELASEMKRPRGRPKLDDPTVAVTFRFKSRAVERFKSLGVHWRKRITEVIEERFEPGTLVVKTAAKRSKPAAASPKKAPPRKQRG